MQLISLGLWSGGGGGGAGPAGPAAIAAWTVETGDAPGELKVIIAGNPDAGDGTVPGDGDGTITGYRWRPAEDGYPWMPFGDGTPGTYVVSDTLIPGEQLRIQIVALGHGGRRGAVATSATVTVAGAPMALNWLHSAVDDAPLYSADDRPLYTLIPDA